MILPPRPPLAPDSSRLGFINEAISLVDSDASHTDTLLPATFSKLAWLEFSPRALMSMSSMPRALGPPPTRCDNPLAVLFPMALMSLMRLMLEKLVPVTLLRLESPWGTRPIPLPSPPMSAPRRVRMDGSLPIRWRDPRRSRRRSGRSPLPLPPPPGLDMLDVVRVSCRTCCVSWTLWGAARHWFCAIISASCRALIGSGAYWSIMATGAGGGIIPLPSSCCCARCWAIARAR
mmetsp:Transcript_49990/g.150381  ORF Transcript_49990/g.150381 Transcript_49990/m.150381 type:complete len:233 (-) Transcript_49990:374-1072(-)